MKKQKPKELNINEIESVSIFRSLIDDSQVNDIVICRFNDIRIRANGKSQKTDASFQNKEDYLKFIGELVAKNDINSADTPLFTFRDSGYDEKFAVDFLVSAVNTVSPYVHIRKLDKEYL